MTTRGSDLEGRVAVVTGAEGALGAAVVEALERRGAVVAGADLRQHRESTIAADLATGEGNRFLVEEVVRRHGRLDVLVLNAGVQHMAPIPEFSEEKWRWLLDVMLTGPFLALQAAWPHLVARPGGRVVLTASTSSFVAEPYKAAYVAAKHGLLGLVKVAALEGAPSGLTVNAVAPSWMRTPMVEAQVDSRMQLLELTREQVIEQLVTEQAVKRFVELDEVAEAVAFLASPAASGITGTCLPVDLGALA